MKRTVLSILLVLLILVLGICAKLFLIGQPVDGSTVNCDVREKESQIDIYVTTPDSAIGLTDFRLRQEGLTLYIDFRKVLTSPLYDGEQSIYIEKYDLTQIILGGKVIWTSAE